MVRVIDDDPKAVWHSCHIDGTVPCLKCGKQIAKNEYGMSDGKRDYCYDCRVTLDVTVFEIIYNKKSKRFRANIKDELFCFSTKDFADISDAIQLIAEAVKKHKLKTVDCGGRKLYWDPMSPLHLCRDAKRSRKTT